MTDAKSLGVPDGSPVRAGADWDALLEGQREAIDRAQAVLREAQAYFSDRMLRLVRELIENGEIGLGMTTLASLIVEQRVPVSASIVNGIISAVTGSSEEEFVPPELTRYIDGTARPR